MMPLSSIAEQTLRILDQGSYDSPKDRISIAQAQREAVAGTELLRPADVDALFTRHPSMPPHGRTEYALTGEKTQEAASRLVQQEGVDDLAVLNFASARKVGGGFLRGAKAQEEDIARSSGLYRCLETQPEYYERNRAASSFLYTDHIIYSPRVPWFRVKDAELLAEPFQASIITAPAPNAKEHLQRNPGQRKVLLECLSRRAGHILALAQARGHGSLLLGAWGCGVFRNDPADVAGVFASHLKSRRFRGCFGRVVFAVFDPMKAQSNYQVFAKELRGLLAR